MVTTVFDSTYPDGYMLKYPIVPEDVGPYVPGTQYNINDVVRHIGSVFKSKINGNTHAPATWDKDSGTVYFNTEFWKILVNGTADYILYNYLHGEIKVLSDDVSELSDELTNVSDEINHRIDTEISSVNERISNVDSNLQNKINSDIANVNERISNVNNNLQGQIDDIEASDTKITTSVNPSIIFANVSSVVNVNSSISTVGGISSHNIVKNGVVIASGQSARLSVNDTVNSSDDVTYVTSAVINGTQKTSSITLKVVNKIYYGSGNNPSNADIPVDTPKATPGGTYSVDVRHNGDNIFIDVPDSMNISSFTVNGFDMPFIIVQSSRTGYKCYKSVNTYDAGNIIIIVE